MGPFRWLAVHTDYEKNRLFVDEQREGPMALWVHQHRFEPVGADATRLTDRVRYRLPGGGIVNALFGWTAKPGLDEHVRPPAPRDARAARAGEVGVQ